MQKNNEIYEREKKKIAFNKAQTRVVQQVQEDNFISKYITLYNI